MIILFLGPAGSGKGTQAERLAKYLGYLYFNMGEMLRELAPKRPDISKVMNEGKLLPDEFEISLAKEYITKNNANDNIIFDGFPRSIKQYEELKKLFAGMNKNIGLAISLKVSKKEVIKRLSTRRQDKVTGKIYNLITDPPPSSVNQRNLITREDDTPKAIENRYTLQYEKSVLPLLEKIKTDGILSEVDGERPIDEIFNDIVRLVKEKNV